MNHQLTLANTLHPHKLPMTTTWHAHNGQVNNQIDFILTPQHFKFKSSINKANARSFPGVGIGSHHDHVFATIKLKLKTKRFTKSPCIRLSN